MTFKILLKFYSKAMISRLFQIASVEHSKDESIILKETFLDPIVEGPKILSVESASLCRSKTVIYCLLSLIIAIQLMI
jgi:hypothetical protein